MKPEPSELVLRGWNSPPLSPPLPPGPPRRFLKKSSKNSSNGEPGGTCGAAPRSPPPPPPLASTVCEVEILTTESITFSAMSAIPSGPRANAGAVAKTLAAPMVIAAAARRRRRLRAGLATVMSAFLQGKSGTEYVATLRPNRAAAQACDRDISAKNRRFAPHDCVDSRQLFCWSMIFSENRYPLFRIILYRRTSQIRTRPATADPMPTTRRILSGVIAALFMARRIHDGLAANNRPSN